MFVYNLYAPMSFYVHFVLWVLLSRAVAVTLLRRLRLFAFGRLFSVGIRYCNNRPVKIGVGE